MDPLLVEAVEEYILTQDSKSWRECIRSENNTYQVLAGVQYRLHWDSFLEGRISKVWLKIMRPVLLEAGNRMSVE